MPLVIAFLIAFFYSVDASQAESVSASAVKATADAMQISYSRIYSEARCDPKQIADVWYLRCYPSNSDIPGGVWALISGPVLIPLNGKAMQHAQTLGLVKDGRLNSTPVKKWAEVFPDTVADIGSILKAFEIEKMPR